VDSFRNPERRAWRLVVSRARRVDMRQIRRGSRMDKLETLRSERRVDNPPRRRFVSEGGVTMHTSFPSSPPDYCARDLVLAFPALVDARLVQCAITAEALEDHFGARSLREDDLIESFLAHRSQIELAARRLLGEVGAKPVLLHSGFFRFCT
jgi:uncharacterized protein DUF1488